MKTLRYIGMALFAITLTFSLASCGGDDDDDITPDTPTEDPSGSDDDPTTDDDPDTPGETGTAVTELITIGDAAGVATVYSTDALASADESVTLKAAPTSVASGTNFTLTCSEQFSKAYVSMAGKAGHYVVNYVKGSIPRIFDDPALQHQLSITLKDQLAIPVLISVMTTSGKMSNTVSVTVGPSAPVMVTSISISPYSLTLIPGGTRTLTATVAPDDATNKNITWQSSNTSVATVNASSTVTAVATGQATITATAQDGSGVKGTMKVTVDHEYVDLGLTSGTKWATMNIGAKNPEDYGYYFAWGETSTKEVYDWSTYWFCNGNGNSLTKYCTSSSYGIMDNQTELELKDDAAHATWGSGWGMPSQDQMKELMDECTWKWVTTDNGTKGYRITGSNGNSIFLPAAGSLCDGALKDVGSWGYYWSKTISSAIPSSAFSLKFDSKSQTVNITNRYFGQPVRAITY